MEDIVISNKNKQWLLIFIVAASIFMFTLDYSMVNISLPNIVRSFNAGINMVSWLPLAYILTVTATLLGFGRLGDLKGFKKVFLSGLAIFVA